jgi:hypothetical protein
LSYLPYQFWLLALLVNNYSVHSGMVIHPQQRSLLTEQSGHLSQNLSASFNNFASCFTLIKLFAMCERNHGGDVTTAT